MATKEAPEKRVWCTQTRQAIGTRARRGPETRVEETALPDPAAVAMTQRLIRLNSQIEDLRALAPDKAEVVGSRFAILQRAVSSGNISTSETPLAQLEVVVAQLLEQAKPKPKSTGPTRQAPTRPVPTPPTPVKPPRAINPDFLKKRLIEVGKRFDQVLPDGGTPATNLKGEFDAVVRDSATPTKGEECLGKLTVIDGKLDTLIATVAAARLAAAKLRVTALSTAVPDPTLKNQIALAVTQETATKTTELKGLLTAASEGQDENIHRETMLGLSQSKDQSYIDNVQKPCDEALATVGEALTSGTPVTPVLTKRLETLLLQLDEQREHYADKTGITDAKMIKQRDAKVAAIDKRKTALKTVLAKVNEIASLKENKEMAARDTRRGELKADGTHAAVTTMVKNLKAMQTTDAEGTKQAIKELQTFLTKADPVTRQVLFADIEDSEGLAVLLRGVDTVNQDAIVTDVIKAKSNKPHLLTELGDELVRSEVRGAENNANGRASALRSNSIATKVTGQFNKQGEGKKFTNEAINPALRGISDTKEELEVDPLKMTDVPEKKKKEAIAKRAGKHKELAREALNNITETKIPDDVSKTCATIYEEAMAKFNDEKLALTLVGGHVMLRLIAPAMNDARSDPNLTDAQKRTILLQTKLLQNLSNGVAPSGKEPALAPFDDLYTKDGGPSPEVTQMQDYFKKSVKDGKRARINLDTVLGDGRALAVFKTYLVGEFAVENIEFWELARNGCPPNPQAAYDTYIIGEKEVNINAPLVVQFKKCKELADAAAGDGDKTAIWKEAPWKDSANWLRAAVQKDNFPRFKSSASWNDCCAVFGC